MDEFVGELQRLRRRAVGLRRMFAAIGAGAPEAAEATDDTGMVRAVLDGAGIPLSILVEQGWARRLSPASLEPAVTRACQAATGIRLAAWSRAVRAEGWRSEDRLRGTEFPGAPPPDDAARRRADARPRSVEGLTGEVLDALHRVDEVAAGSTLAATGTGAAGSGCLAVVVSRAGLVSCRIDARWAAGRSGSELTSALRAALTVARDELTLAERSRHAVTAGLDRLFAEAMATLTDPDRLANS